MTETLTARGAEEIGRTPRGPRPFPPLGAQRTYRLPPFDDLTLPNGLRVLSVYQPSTPMVELRLRIPLLDAAPGDIAAAELLAITLLRGNGQRGHWEIDTELAERGASLEATRGATNFSVAGSAPADSLPFVLAALTELLAGAAHAEPEVLQARQRTAQQIGVLRAQPQVIAQEALRVRCFGDPAALCEIPTVEDVAVTTAAQVQHLHRRLIRPNGAVLVLVGDLRPDLAQVLEETIAAWPSTPGARGELATAPSFRPGPVIPVHRASAVQSQIRLTTPVPSRQDARFPALSLANLVFGGYFSSRLVTNIRETKGYAYRADSRFEDVLDQMMITIEADSATENTIPALAEIHAELDRVANKPIGAKEIESARQYLLGMGAISVTSQAGLATNLSSTIGFGLPPQWLTTFPEQLLAVPVDQVQQAAAEFFRPERFNGVVLGDSDLLKDLPASAAPTATFHTRSRTTG